MPNWTQLRKTMLDENVASCLPADIKVPALPDAVLKFSRRSQDSDAKLPELAGIIEADSGLTCELLKYVNSSAMGRRFQAVSAHQALSALGLRKTKLFLLAKSLEISMKASVSRLLDMRAFWRSNLQRALFAREVAEVLEELSNRHQ